MRSFIEIVEDRIDDIGVMVSNTDASKYENILNKLREIVNDEILDLIDELEGAIIDKHRVFEIEIYKQAFKDGMHINKDL